MIEKTIVVKDLKKTYGTIKAVDGISFEVLKGKIFGLLGPNGAGKSTTIETIVGLIKRDAGELSILGFDPEQDIDKIKKRIGVQLQNPSLFDSLTSIEIIDLFASFYPDPLRPEDALQKVGLENRAKQQTKFLSGGERHRLAIALALVSNGEIIILDEPTSGLDPNARRQLWNVILDLKKNGSTVLLTTHFMDEAERLCDDVVLIDHGEIIAHGSPKKLVDQHFQEQALEFSDPGFLSCEREGLNELTVVNRVVFEEKTGVIVLYSDKIAKTISQLNEYCDKLGKQVENITVRRATLEDLFIKLTGRGFADENL